jgi:hypothetical protein
VVGELGAVDLLPGLGALHRQCGIRRVVRERRLVRVGGVDRFGDVGASLLSYQSTGSVLSHQSNGAVLSSQTDHALLGRRTDGSVPPGVVGAAVLSVLVAIAVHRALRSP